MAPISGVSSTDATNKATKRKWTSKRTRNQFSVYIRPQRHQPCAPVKNSELANKLLEHAVTTSPAVNPSEKDEQRAAGMQTAALDEPTESLLRLQANEVNLHQSNPTTSAAVTNATMADDITQMPMEMHHSPAGDTGAATVPRSFNYTDLTILSDDSDQDTTVESSVIKASMHDESPFLPEAENSPNQQIGGMASPETKAERLSTPKRPRTGIHVTTTGLRRDIIFIESSDEDGSAHEDACSPLRQLTLAEASFDVPTSEPFDRSAKDAYSPTQTAVLTGSGDASAEIGPSFDKSASEPHATSATLESPSFDMPTSAPPAASVDGVCSPDMSQTTPLVSSSEASAENGSSEDDIPLAELRQEKSLLMSSSKPRALWEYFLSPTRSPTNFPVNKHNATAENESSEDNVPLSVLRKEVSFAMPSSKPRPSWEPVYPLTRSPTNVFVNDHNATAENESSEDNVPLSVLRQNRLRGKRRLSGDDQPEFAIVNRPTSVARRSTANRKQAKAFDSDAFDAMIYSQSEVQPPFGVSVPRPMTASSTDPRDDRVFVHVNPAIHGPVVRTEKWKKDKTREIRSRPNRKRWFGKPAARMRWLYNKQMEEKMKRQVQNKGSAGRTMRQDPQPVGYKRIMDYGDVAEDRLPPEVLSNSAWVKACAWTREMRSEDVALWREVKHSTNKTWQHYQDVLQEDG